MKTVLLCLCIALATGAAAQTTVNKTFPVQPGQQVELEFDHPEQVRISTWERSEVSIRATVSINGGENDTAFSLKEEVRNGKLYIRNIINNLKNLPKIYTVMRGGLKTTFRSKEDLQVFVSQNGRNYQYTSEGVDIEISLDIKIPANTATSVSTVFGAVAMENVAGPITIKTVHGGIDVKLSENLKGPVSFTSVHGHVDVSMPAATRANLKLTTNHGEIFTASDLRIDMDKTTSGDMINYSKVRGTLNGGGTEVILSSTHNRIYLRKS